MPTVSENVDECGDCALVTEFFSNFTYSPVMVPHTPMVWSKLGETRIQPAMHILEIVPEKLDAISLVLGQRCHIEPRIE
jgi:hypothetical protein